MAIIEVENVTKRYRAARGVRALLGRGGLPDLVRGRRPDEVTALEGVTFTTPSEGSVRVFGRVASLLELGAGFHPLLSGRENVYLNAGIHGMRHAQVDAMFDQIVEFSGIGSFIEYPVSTYSSGMSAAQSRRLKHWNQLNQRGTLPDPKRCPRQSRQHSFRIDHEKLCGLKAPAEWSEQDFSKTVR